MHREAFASGMIGAGLGLLLIMGVAASQPPTDEPIQPTLVPCATEDSDNCYWDADTSGNQQGTDSVVITPTPEPTAEPSIEPEPMPTEIPMELPEAAGRPADFEQAQGPVSQYDEGVLFCGTDAMPAIDQDPYGNWWAYCEPAMVDQP